MKTNQKKPAETQIVIEESELIRFLQTGEGAELIGKAYNLPVVEFLNFVKNSQLMKREPTNTKQSGMLSVNFIANLYNGNFTAEFFSELMVCMRCLFLYKLYTHAPNCRQVLKNYNRSLKLSKILLKILFCFYKSVPNVYSSLAYRNSTKHVYALS